MEVLEFLKVLKVLEFLKVIGDEMAMQAVWYRKVVKKEDGGERGGERGEERGEKRGETRHERRKLRCCSSTSFFRLQRPWVHSVEGRLRLRNATRAAPRHQQKDTEGYDQSHPKSNRCSYSRSSTGNPTIGSFSANHAASRCWNGCLQ